MDMSGTLNAFPDVSVAHPGKVIKRDLQSHRMTQSLLPGLQTPDHPSSRMSFRTSGTASSG